MNLTKEPLFRITAIGGGMLAGGPQGGAGGAPMAAPQMPIALPPIPKVDPSSLYEDSVSEPPIGWPIVGVVSRSGLGSGPADSGKGDAGGPAGGSKPDPSDRTFKIYKGHDKISEWQFHVFDFGAELPQAPGVGGPKVPNLGGPIGPGHGGKGTSRLGPEGPQPGGGQQGVPWFNRKGEGWQPGPRARSERRHGRPTRRATPPSWDRAWRWKEALSSNCSWHGGRLPTIP